MIHRGRNPREWPAASATGDVTTHQPGSRVGKTTCEHRWWEGPLSWLIVALAIAIALIPIAFVGWVVVETCT